MTIRVELVNDSNRDAYRRFVLGCTRALAQQTWEWGQVVCDVGQDQPVFLLARDGCDTPLGALPAFVFECELGSLLISIPQAGGYGGIIVEDLPYKEDVYKCLLNALVDEARKRGCVLTTISTPPFFGERDLYRRHFEPDFEKENFYQFIDLQTDFLAALGGKRRYNLLRSVRQARDLGLRVVFEQDKDRFGQWYAIYRQRMSKLGVHPLPSELFEAARAHLCSRGLGFFGYVLEGDKVIAGAFFIGVNQVLDVFSLSADEDHSDKQPNNLLVHEVLASARERGFRYFNWQSSISRDSGVYRYKKGWGSQEGCHYYLTKITGDISRLRSAPLDVVKQRYQWHYVMPYEFFQADHRMSRSEA